MLKLRKMLSRKKIYEILTDIGHILGGGVAGFLSINNIYGSIFYTILYFIYQSLEHLEYRDDDFIGDLREYIIGFTIGLFIALGSMILG